MLLKQSLIASGTPTQNDFGPEWALKFLSCFIPVPRRISSMAPPTDFFTSILELRDTPGKTAGVADQVHRGSPALEH